MRLQLSCLLSIWVTRTCSLIKKSLIHNHRSMHDSTLHLIHGCSKIRDSVIIRHANSNIVNGFSLENYSKENILNQASSAINIKFVGSVTDSQDHGFIEKDMASRICRSTVILTSIQIRHVDDIQARIPDLDKFIAKLQLSNQELSVDKFLYSHDIGGSNIHKMAISRIPTLTYQKLDLARKIVDFIGSSASQGIDIYMLDMFNDRFFDLAMCEALQAAFQMSQFTLPNFKRDSTSTQTKAASVGTKGGQSQSSIGASSLDEQIQLNFILPSSGQQHFISSNSDENNDNISDSSQAQQQQQQQLESKTDALTTESIYDTYLKSTAMINQGTNTARALSTLPPNILNPATYTALVRQICQSHNDNNNDNQLEYIEWTPQQLQELGCGAFLAVTQANGDIAERTDRLVRIKYTPSISAPLATSSSSISTALSTSATVKGTGNIQVKKEFNFWRDQVDVAVADVERVNELQSNNSESDIAASSSLSFSYFFRINSGSNNNDSGTSRSFNRPMFNQQQKQMQKPLVLVGKGVCYDTGGINLKTANSMKTMKHDMAGSAAALGTLLALVKTNYTRPVECWMAIVENNINQYAFRPDDVITSVTGETIEIVHSDAEGRMLLADVLAIASRKVDIPSFNSFTSESPALLIDFATLTGTCISSVSNRYIGAFTNRREYIEKLILCGESCGERAWPFPLDEDFNDDLLSDVADVLQCRQATEADHIYAASFLKRFVHSIVPWIHLDMGSAHRSAGLGHVPSDYTGCGVRLATEIIKTILPST